MFLSDMSPWLVCCCYKITKKEIGFALHPRLPGGETFRNRVPNMNSINEFEAGSARGGFAAVSVGLAKLQELSSDCLRRSLRVALPRSGLRVALARSALPVARSARSEENFGS